MEQNLKNIFYAMGAMILAPQTLCAQSVNIEGLDSLRLSGSVSVVEPELLKKGVLNNALDALSGQTAGVNVTTNGLDRIAMLNSVRVRGTTSIMGGNDPLVIIDGVTSDVATLATIYPADIESFTHGGGYGHRAGQFYLFRLPKRSVYPAGDFAAAGGLCV